VHFALGKAYAKYANIADPDKTFAHWLSGNGLKRQQIDYDEAAMAAQFAQIEETFTLALVGAKSGHGDPPSIPAFVLGLPRSGTTLVEQILVSHPRVDGAGKLMLLSNLLSPHKARTEELFLIRNMWLRSMGRQSTNSARAILPNYPGLRPRQRMRPTRCRAVLCSSA